VFTFLDLLLIQIHSYFCIFYSLITVQILPFFYFIFIWFLAIWVLFTWFITIWFLFIWFPFMWWVLIVFVLIIMILPYWIIITISTFLYSSYYVLLVIHYLFVLVFTNIIWILFDRTHLSLLSLPICVYFWNMTFLFVSIIRFIRIRNNQLSMNLDLLFRTIYTGSQYSFPDKSIRTIILISLTRLPS